MNILVAVDQNPYSAHTVVRVANLAANTWANVTFLGVQPKKGARETTDAIPSSGWGIDAPLPRAVRDYRETFLSHFKEEDCPYTQREFGYKLIEVKKGIWEELYISKSAKKELRARIRVGNPVKEILAEAQEEESDLIVLGCNNEKGCIWEGGNAVPQKVANEAACSVFVIKEEKEINRVVCCLDHDSVSQQSLEMINQLVTLYQARLEIVGLTEGEGLRAEIEKKIDAILRYYTARNIEPWIELVELTSLESFISQEAKWGLMALWMGKKSILGKVLSKGKVERIIKASKSSVLLLR